jgi:hypothetical protein
MIDKVEKGIFDEEIIDLTNKGVVKKEKTAKKASKSKSLKKIV